MQATIIHHYIPIQYSGIYMPSEPFYAYWVLGNYNTFNTAVNSLYKGGVLMSFLKRNISGLLGSFLLAFVYVLHWKGCSLLYFGEYPFPEDE